MTDADDAGLLIEFSAASFHVNATDKTAAKARLDKAWSALSERLSTQRREIEELREALVDARQDLARRREVAKAHEERTRKIVAAGAEALTRAEKAEAALAKAAKIIRDLRMHADGATSIATLEAASAFAAKHGGRDE